MREAPFTLCHLWATTIPRLLNSLHTVPAQHSAIFLEFFPFMRNRFTSTLHHALRTFVIAGVVAVVVTVSAGTTEDGRRLFGTLSTNCNDVGDIRVISLTASHRDLPTEQPTIVHLN